jgi:rhodanese-related sulfurtransferase
MFQLLKNIFGFKDESLEIKNALQEGAYIVDVRTQPEFNRSHLNNAINIPLDTIEACHKQYLDRNKPIIVYCASGMRSKVASNFLLNHGYTRVYNAKTTGRLEKLL